MNLTSVVLTCWKPHERHSRIPGRPSKCIDPDGRNTGMNLSGILAGSQFTQRNPSNSVQIITLFRNRPNPIMTYSSNIDFIYNCDSLRDNEMPITVTVAKYQLSNTFIPFTDFGLKVHFITLSRI